MRKNIWWLHFIWYVLTAFPFSASNSLNTLNWIWKFAEYMKKQKNKESISFQLDKIFLL